ncbi:MAG: hypothetical protein ABEI39_02590 [Halobacteriales archaeon]
MGDAGTGGFGKDLAVALIVVAGFVAVLPVPLVQIPGYALLRGFAALEAAVPGLDSGFGLGVLVYLLALAAVAAVLAGPLRERTTARPWFRAPVVAALTLVGGVLLAVAAGIAAGVAGEGPVSAPLAVGAAVVTLGLAAIAQGLGRRVDGAGPRDRADGAGGDGTGGEGAGGDGGDRSG